MKLKIKNNNTWEEVPIVSTPGLTYNDIYPVGSIYETSKPQSEFDPNVIFGGTWTLIQGKVLVGAGTSDVTYTLGTSGGASRVTLTAAESGVGSHTHNTGRDGLTFVISSETPTPHKVTSGSTTTYNYWYTTDNASIGRTTNISSTSATATASHENMPPYKVVNIWERIA